MPDWLAEAETAVLGAEPGCPLAARVEAGDGVYWIRVRDVRAGADAQVETVGLESPAVVQSRAGGRLQTVGAIAVTCEGDSLRWTWLAVGAAWRAMGYGGAAVPLIERAAKRGGLLDARALAPASNGVALYFWLRLGYRPLAVAAWPKPCEGTWMSRTEL